MANPLLFSGELINNSAACQKYGRKIHLLLVTSAMSNYHNALSLTLTIWSSLIWVYTVCYRGFQNNSVGSELDCRFRGCEFDPSPVPYFHRD